MFGINFGKNKKEDIKKAALVAGITAVTAVSAFGNPEKPTEKAVDANKKIEVAVPAAKEKTNQETTVSFAEAENIVQIKKTELIEKKKVLETKLQNYKDTNTKIENDFKDLTKDVAGYLEKHGNHANSKKMLDVQNLPSLLSERVKAIIQDPHNTNINFSTDARIDQLKSIVMSFEDPKTGKMVKELNDVLLGEIASTSGANSIDQQAHQYFSSTPYEVIGNTAHILQLEKELKSVEQEISNLSTVEM